MILPERSSKSASSLSARPSPMMMPPLNWLVAVFALRIRPQSNEPKKARDPTLPSDSVHPNLAELRAVGVHRVFHHLERRRRFCLAYQFVALRASEDRDI